ncbi:MAG: zinc ABC transporter substrate-binding protein [Candidatus Methanoplasma sp.]|jgi:ABC-type Zn uptake system ZnuABC Zn-binding protein ZnuA|nr:zinc ABC transporter substrate-binding protein [Candidatus Methanoplasma sp.]
MRHTVAIIAAIAAIIIVAAAVFVAVGSDRDDRETLVVTMPWQKELVEEVAGDGYRVYVLIPQGTSPHDTAQISVKSITEINESKAWFMIGTGVGMESEIAIYEKVRDSIPPNRIVDMSVGMRLIEGDEHDHGDGDEDEDEEGITYNTHVWCDYDNLMIAADNAKSALIRMDPSNADAFEKGCEAYKDRAAAIKAKAEPVLKAIHGKLVMVWHEAWGYLLSKQHIGEFGLQDLVGHEAKELTVSNITALNAAISGGGHKVLFASPHDLIANSSYRSQIGVPIEIVDPTAERFLDELDRFIDLLDAHKGDFPADPAHGHH